MNTSASTPSVQRLRAHFGPVSQRGLATAVEALRTGACEDPAEDAPWVLCASLCWIAFAAPAQTRMVYDDLCRQWLGTGPEPEQSGQPAAAEPPPAFWTAFEAVLEGPAEGYDASSITAAVAALGGQLAPDYLPLAEAAARDHCAPLKPALEAVPAKLSLAPLGRCPEASLGRALYDLWVQNGFDPEVLDREQIQLSALPPALCYLNTRILQMHDVWHLVAGYETTALHEIAISAFQLAQFGHNYSAQFLATVAVITQRRTPAFLPVLLTLYCEAWRHGRGAPAFMGIEWEQHWHQPISELRAAQGIVPFAGSLPADLFEQQAAAAG